MLPSLCVAVLTLFLLAGCGALPSNGPIASDVVNQSANKSINDHKAEPITFELVDVTTEVGETVSSYRHRIFNSSFGFGSHALRPTIGIGDVLQVTIFEAGPDGLFSTTDNKTTTVTAVVQPDGKAAIPYVGPINFAGQTLENARKSIVRRLQSKAVEPDVTINVIENKSRSVSVSGSVASPKIVSLGLTPSSIMEVIAQAGGPTSAPYETFISISRKGKTRKALLQSLVSDAKENIYAQPGDQIFLTTEPQTFTVLGSTGKSSQVKFQSVTVNVLEAAALASGPEISLADPKGFFIFRYEYKEALTKAIGRSRFDELLDAGLEPNQSGLYPIVYRVDLTSPSNFMVGQNFLLRDKDVVYLSRHPSSDFIRFLGLLQSVIGTTRSISTL